jgi:hypothetical protein
VSEIARGFGRQSPLATIEHWTAWGGVPRYWELAAAQRGPVRDRVVGLALDPRGALFGEPDRLLLEELPPAAELRPMLDVIGAGAHRLSEIAGRLGRAATSLAYPMDRLIGMGLVQREVPYGEPERGGKRSLYKLADPFLRMWFRVVAPNRSALSSGTPRTRRTLLDEHWTALASLAWEDLCRSGVPGLRGALGKLGPWRPPLRYWHGAEPEWDLVADALTGSRVLLGEAWLAERPVTRAVLAREAARVRARPAPRVLDERDVVRALFVPAVAKGTPHVIDGVHVVTLANFG